jgi:hypothetical protein
MLDGGRLVVSRPIEALMTTTGTVTVEVDDGLERLLAELDRVGLAATAVDGRAEVIAPDREAVLDVIRDAIADLGLPLVRMSSRLSSLDDVFLRQSSKR